MRKRGIVCVATEQGLGRQAKSYFDNGLIDEVFCHTHSTYVNHYEWYPNRSKTFEEMLDKVDEVWFLETPYDWSYILKARERGIKTVLFLMYECSSLRYTPDVLVGGSIMERIHYGDAVKVIPVPAPKEIEWKLRKRAEVFIHNAGHGGLGGRNGTKELLEAMKWVKSPIRLIIRSQNRIEGNNDPRIEFRIGDFEYKELFEEGDVFIYPDKFGGSCLPVQEAHCAGMLVMVSKRLPHTEWLPNEPLIPIEGYKKERYAEKEFDSAILDPKKIAETIDAWYGKDIESYSLQGKEWAIKNSWDNLYKEYEAI